MSQESTSPVASDYVKEDTKDNTPSDVFLVARDAKLGPVATGLDRTRTSSIACYGRKLALPVFLLLAVAAVINFCAAIARKSPAAVHSSTNPYNLNVSKASSESETVLAVAGPRSNVVDIMGFVNVVLLVAPNQQFSGDYVFSNSEPTWTAKPLEIYYNKGKEVGYYSFRFPTGGTFYIMYISPLDWEIHATLQVLVDPPNKITSISGSNLQVGASSFRLTVSVDNRGVGDYIFSNSKPEWTETPLQVYNTMGLIAVTHDFIFDIPGTYYVMYVSSLDWNKYYTLGPLTVTTLPSDISSITGCSAGTCVADTNDPVNVVLTTANIHRIQGDYIFSNTAREWTPTPIQIFMNNAQVTAEYTFKFSQSGTFYIMYISPIDWEIHATITVQIAPTTKITSVSGSNQVQVGTSAFFLTTAPIDRRKGDYVFSNTDATWTSSPLEIYQNNGKIAALYNFTFSKPGVYYVMYVTAYDWRIAYTLEVHVGNGPF